MDFARIGETSSLHSLFVLYCLSYLRQGSNTPHDNRTFLTETIGATSSTKEHDSSRRTGGKLPRRKGGDAKNMPPLKRLQSRASPVQSAEGSVLHAPASTATSEPATSRQTILPDPRERGRRSHHHHHHTTLVCLVFVNVI